MLRRTLTILAILALLRAEDCSAFPVVTLEGIGSKDQWVTDTSFEGLWVSVHSAKDTVRVVASDGHYLATSWTAGGVPQQSDLHFTRIAGQLYVDVFPKDLQSRNLDNALPAHSFLRVEQVRPVFKARVMSEFWLKRFAAAHPHEITAVNLGSPIILADSTAALRSFLRLHAADSGAFSKDSTMWTHVGPARLRQ